MKNLKRIGYIGASLLLVGVGYLAGVLHQKRKVEIAIQNNLLWDRALEISTGGSAAKAYECLSRAMAERDKKARDEAFWKKMGKELPDK